MKRFLYAILSLILLVLLAVITAGVGLHVSAHSRQRAVRTAVAPGGGRYVPAGDCEIYVQEAGPHSAPLLLIVGGTGSWSGLWKTELEIAGEIGFHAVAVDLPPFGYFLKPTNDDYTREAQAKRLEKLIESLAPPSVTIVGHSFGGGPVLTLAARLPAVVKELLLVDPALGWPPPPEFLARDPDPVTRFLLGTVPVRLALAGIVTHPSLQKLLLQKVLYRKEMATEEKVELYARQMSVQGKSEETGKWLADFLTIHDGGIVEHAEFFGRVKAKTTILWGEHDDVTPIWQGEKLALLLPGSKLVPLPGVGHVPQIEDPPAFLAEFRNFAKEAFTEVTAPPPTAPVAPAPAPPASPASPAPAPAPARSSAPPAPGSGGASSAAPARPSY
jgi:pimeloyl-ACP methyl ester carboxylesterase